MKRYYLKVEQFTRLRLISYVIIGILIITNIIFAVQIHSLNQSVKDLYKMYAYGMIKISSDLSNENTPNEEYIKNNNSNALRLSDGLTEGYGEVTSLGTFTITHYCHENYPHICNNGDSTNTASGAIATVGRTVAVDTDLIPFGTHLLIDGHEYIAEDRGGSVNGKEIDILVETHQEALELGVYQTEVYMIE